MSQLTISDPMDLLHAFEGIREVEKQLNKIAAPGRIDPDDDDKVLEATHAAMDRAFSAIVLRVGFNMSDYVVKARALKIMDESCGDAIVAPDEKTEALIRQIIDWLASQPIGGER